mmetsp:Transcript_47298/g.120700  ORF Transcript_47298/g.120700 Transcript_47298/m.120700 type:complete len:332 (+) Transcript_47298:87-1082(+)
MRRKPQPYLHPALELRPPAHSSCTAQRPTPLPAGMPMYETNSACPKFMPPLPPPPSFHKWQAAGPRTPVTVYADLSRCNIRRGVRLGRWLTRRRLRLGLGLGGQHPAGGLEVQPVHGVDGGAGRHADGGRVHVQLKVEAAHQHRERADGLKQRKLVADTLPAAAAKGEVLEPRGGLVGDGAQRAKLLPHGPELVRLLPQLRGPVQVPHRDEHVVALLAGVAVEVVLLQRAADEHRRLRVQAHGLVDHACGELELLHVGQRGLAVANHTVHLLLDPLRVLRVLGQQEEGPGEHRGRGLMARDQQRHQVVTQLLGRDVVAGGNEEVQDGGVLC